MTNPLDDDGGRAFPVMSPCACAGMSMRQWYAGQALSSMSQKSYETHGREGVARHCRRMADIMVAQDEARPGAFYWCSGCGLSFDDDGVNPHVENGLGGRVCPACAGVPV